MKLRWGCEDLPLGAVLPLSLRAFLSSIWSHLLYLFIKQKSPLILNIVLCSPTTNYHVQINLHTTLPFGIGTTKLGLIKAVHALSTVLLMVATFAHTTPPRTVPKWPKSFPFHKIWWLFDLGDLWIWQSRTVRFWGRPNICNTHKTMVIYPCVAKFVF